MDKFEAIKADLLRAFDNLSELLQIEYESEILVTEYPLDKQSYIVRKNPSGESQFLININGVEINVDQQIFFKIKNAKKICFIPTDGENGLLKFGKLNEGRCDFVFFDDYNFCFVEFKLNVTSTNPKTIRQNRFDAIRQITDTVDVFNKKLNNNYHGLKLEAYICPSEILRRFPSVNAKNETLSTKFREKYSFDLFETREKICQQVLEE